MSRASKPLLLATRAILLAAVLASIAGPWLFAANTMTVLTEFFIVLTLALMWNLLAGYADIISVASRASWASAPTPSSASQRSPI
jgi:branched-chain amino acid transport system permease protein